MKAKILYLTAVIALILSACAPKPLSTQAPVSEPPAATEPSTATEPPAALATATEASTVAEATPTLAAIDLGGPVMEVGATYLYVDGSTLVAVPGGEFIMGYGNDDNLEHKVTLGDFWIYRDEVTNSQYALCVLLGKCSLPDTNINVNYGKNLRRNDPATGVNWDQAQAYCEFVNGRLPTEAEWEKTARGPDGNVYPWGDAAVSCDLANIGRCNNETKEVNDYPEGASYYGAGNMTGNVFEWVADWYEAQYYRVSPAENPLGPESGVYRSVRSTAFRSDFFLGEAARRFREIPVKARDDLGFRCVVENPAQFAPWCQTVAIVNPNQSGGGPISDSVPVPDCPNIGITTGGFCNKNFDPPVEGAYLDFSADPLPASAIVSVPAGCALDGGTGDPTDYFCSGVGGEGSASIQAVCTVPPPAVPAGCAPGYTQNGNICEFTGGAVGGVPVNTCLPGVNYDPTTQCCQAIPGGTDSYTLCPSDAPYYVGGMCVPWPVEDIVSQTVSVGFGSCGTTDGGDDCQLNATICRGIQGQCFNPQTCTCYYSTTGGCP